MSYAVKEIFHTIQGEGFNLGRAAIFVRFSGCNLWSGREEDRDTAICRFCDTDFVGGSRWGATGLAMEAHRLWGDSGNRFCVLTGGEPALQIDDELIAALRANGFRIAIETNGTRPLPDGIDWICISPKASAAVVLKRCDELKLVYPQDDGPAYRYAHFPAAHYWLSPMDGPRLRENIEAAAAYCRAHPQWRLAIQAHKTWSIP